MCGRYYINEETAREIEKAAGLADEIRRGPWAMGISPGEICPTDRAPVLAGKEAACAVSGPGGDF